MYLEMDHIKLDGVSNITKGIILLDADLPDVDRDRDATPMINSLQAVESEYWQYEPGDIPILLAVIGESMDELLTKYQDARRWLMPCTILELSNFSGYFFSGVITKIVKTETTEKWIKFTATFRANPYCTQRCLSQQAGFVPAINQRTPEQITAGNATCSGSFSSAGALPAVNYAGVHDAAMYLAVTGTWTTLAIGGADGLVLNWPAATSKTVYINCDLEYIYRLEAGQPADLYGYTSGKFPQLTGPGAMAMAVAGTNINVTVRLLVIERG